MEKNIKYPECEKIWILRLLDNKTFSKKLNILFHFLILIIIFTPFLYTRWSIIQNFEVGLLLALLLSITWYGISPLLILKYDNIYEKFWHECHSLLKEKDSIQEFKEKFDKRIIRLSKHLTILWCPLLLSVIFINPDYLVKLGFEIWSDPYFYVFLIALTYVLHLTVIGFTGAIVTIQIIV